MKKKRFTEEQIAFALRQAESGTPVLPIRNGLRVGTRDSRLTAHYDSSRPHSNRNHRPPRDQAEVPEWTSIKLEDVECLEQLGGVIKSMHRRLA